VTSRAAAFIFIKKQFLPMPDIAVAAHGSILVSTERRLRRLWKNGRRESEPNNTERRDDLHCFLAFRCHIHRCREQRQQLRVICDLATGKRTKLRQDQFANERDHIFKTGSFFDNRDSQTGYLIQFLRVGRPSEAKDRDGREARLAADPIQEAQTRIRTQSEVGDNQVGQGELATIGVGALTEQITAGLLRSVDAMNVARDGGMIESTLKQKNIIWVIFDIQDRTQLNSRHYSPPS
jgi:hypothetical protein